MEEDSNEEDEVRKTPRINFNISTELFKRQIYQIENEIQNLKQIENELKHKQSKIEKLKIRKEEKEKKKLERIEKREQRKLKINKNNYIYNQYECIQCKNLRDGYLFTKINHPCYLCKKDEGPERHLEKLLNHTIHRTNQMKKKSRDYQMDIDLDWLIKEWTEKEGLCALCGTSMNYEPTPPKYNIQGERNCVFTKTPYNASLDRKNSAIGYIKENVQLVHLRCNLSKLDMNLEEFIQMCSNVSKHHLKKNN